MHDSYWVFAKHPKKDTSHIIGKWLVFKDLDSLDEAWSQIRSAVLEQRLASCVEAKASTVRYNPSRGGPGPKKNGVICVYTGENDEDAIGFQLIEIVKQTTSYKLNDVTRAGAYSHQGLLVSNKTLYWNEGKPSFENTVKISRRSGLVDKWQLNVVRAPEPLGSARICGRWIVYLPTPMMTEYWHMLKKDIESKDSNFGVVKMECPRVSKKNPPRFLFFTSKEWKDKSGEALAIIFDSEIVDCKIEYKEEEDLWQLYRERGLRVPGSMSLESKQ